MKSFGIWLMLAFVIFGGMSGGYHIFLNKNPRKILVAVDTSFPMSTLQYKVSATLGAISHQRYTLFALITEKNKIHGWASELNSGPLSFYAPRDFSKFKDLNQYPEYKEASRHILLTNAPSSETENLKGWEIIHLRP